ncbi:MAG: DsbA family protein [Pseudorhodoplanes sp.]|nr:DsbA family protein [Pseudorhodoplanes sp.]
MRCGFWAVAAFLAGLAIATHPAAAQAADSEKLAAEHVRPERAFGSSDAPVTVIEYFSFGCHHCANFHRTAWPAIRDKYVDTGKVRFVFREFPLDLPSLAAAMLTRCVGDERWYEATDRLFKDQDVWSHSGKPGEALAEVARTLDMPREQFDACMLNTVLYQNIRQAVFRARDELGIASTPTFFVNGEKRSGAVSADDLGAMIEQALSRAAR